MSDRHPSPRDAAEHVLEGELRATFANAVLDREGFCIQFLGMDDDGRAVYYCSDDGHVLRYEYVSGDRELERVDSSFIGPELENKSNQVDPFGTAFAYLTTHGEDWTWIHPRFRWMKDAMDGLTREQTA